jgi:hypothetical protein
MEKSESNSNAKLTSFSQEEATSSLGGNNLDNRSKKTENILNKDIVTRPLLWGLVVFLVFFALVIGGVSVYRIYNTGDDISQNISNSNISYTTNSETNAQTSPVVNNTPVGVDTTQEANIVESEIKTIDSDLEGEIYSDESLGL